MIHELKILSGYFKDVLDGRKSFEVRKNDRDFREGDLLALNEYGEGGYTGRCCLVKIDYILNDKNYVLKDYVILGIKPCGVGIYDGIDLNYTRNIFAVELVPKQPTREVVKNG